MNRLIQDKLAALRGLMKQNGLAAYLVPRADEFQNEFVAPYAERLKYLTGFTGSAGLVIIMEDKACLMTDARYTEQASKQCDPALFEVVDSAAKTPSDYLAEKVKGTVGYDPWLHTPEQIRKHEEKGMTLKPIPGNLIDAIWQDQPKKPPKEIIPFPDKIAGLASDDKIKAIRKSFGGCEAVIITLSDSLSWLLNVRGSQIPYIPAVLGYALVTKDKLQTFDDQQTLLTALKTIKTKTGLDFKRAPTAIKDALETNGAEVIDLKDPCIDLKSIKTKAEQNAIRQTHIRDGTALVKFLHWFENNKEPLSEMGVVQKLEEFRKQDPAYRQPSFPTIAGFGANAAIIHYRPTAKTNATIDKDGLLLIDSGGQYGEGDVWGTTDVTRTIAVGKPSQEMKENFTRALKGHISLASAKFKQGTLGKDLDVLARASLKEAGLNYAHGTGHGVGCYLGVHEEAASISPKGETAVEPGMLISNEPGYYKSGHYGIRIENLVLCQDDFTFETLTLCPIDLSLIVESMLTPEEKTWLNNYHQTVKEKLSLLLNSTEKAWLEKATSAL